jgi:NAD dependent epimerase/dehydratase family enzyme
MKEFANALGKILNRPSIFSVPKFALELLVGESASPILSSQRVMPQKLIDHGFKFKFENLEDALRDLLKTKRA